MNAPLEDHGNLGAAEDFFPKRIAIVHDWLPEIGGAERVLSGLLKILPQAHLYSLVDFLSESDRALLHGKRVRTSFVQNLPGARRFYRAFLPLMPLAVEHFDLSQYDLVISSSYAVAKGVLTGPDQLHLCYCHSPVRYAWDLQESYLRQTGCDRGLKGFLARALLHYIRLWDCRTANGVDGFAANSRFIQRRIWKTYRRRSRLIYPPVDLEEAARGGLRSPRTFYLSLGRLVPYKRIDLLIEAFRGMPSRRLKIIGDGPEYARLSRDLPPNVSLEGRVPRRGVLEALSQARALVYAAEEDFGIAPVEAMAAGTPVIAYGRGGVCESVTHGVSGVLFREQSVPAVQQAVAEAEEMVFDSRRIQRNAARFGCEVFESSVKHWISTEWKSFCRRIRPCLS